MQARSAVPVAILAGVALASVSCKGEGPTKEDLKIANIASAESLSILRGQLIEQMMEGTRFVNEINAELSKARSMAIPPRELEAAGELFDANEERRQVVARITQLVTRLDNVSFRLSTTRNALIQKDSALAKKVAEYELLVAEVNLAAERQRAELQAVIDAQTSRIAELTGKVDTLSSDVARLTSEKHAAFVIVGTRRELLKKGVLVPEGPRRFGVVGSRTVVPARNLDPSAFTRIDRTADRAILLPNGVYKIVTRQNTSFAEKPLNKRGFEGAIMIAEPEKFWNISRFLILVRS